LVRALCAACKAKNSQQEKNGFFHSCKKSLLVPVHKKTEVIDILKGNASAKGQWQSFVRT
jgi:hypothetical protein